MALTEAEQNRFIQGHMHLPEMIASGFRGARGIPFEDLCSAGVVGLVQAARGYRPIEGIRFSTFAHERISGAIKDFIAEWQEFVRFDGGDADEDRVHWWDIWADIPFEGWTKLVATPEEIVGRFEEIEHKTAAVRSALLSLRPRERQMIEARFLRRPKIGIDQIAREHKLSYDRTMTIIHEAVKKMAEVVGAIDRKSKTREAASHLSVMRV